MRWRYAAAGLVIVLMAALGVVIALAAMSGGTAVRPDQVGACKAALRQQFYDALKSGRSGQPLAECAGLSADTVQRLAYEVLDEEMAR